MFPLLQLLSSSLFFSESLFFQLFLSQKLFLLQFHLLFQSLLLFKLLLKSEFLLVSLLLFKLSLFLLLLLNEPFFLKTHFSLHLFHLELGLLFAELFLVLKSFLHFCLKLGEHLSLLGLQGVHLLLEGGHHVLGLGFGGLDLLTHLVLDRDLLTHLFGILVSLEQLALLVFNFRLQFLLLKFITISNLPDVFLDTCFVTSFHFAPELLLQLGNQFGLDFSFGLFPKKVFQVFIQERIDLVYLELYSFK